MSAPKYAVGSTVTWDRGKLPRGTGVVKEVKLKVDGEVPVYMVREPNGNVHCFMEDQLTQGNSS